MGAQRKTDTENVPDAIYGTEMAKAIMLEGRVSGHHLRRVDILREMGAYKVRICFCRIERGLGRDVVVSGPERGSLIPTSVERRYSFLPPDADLKAAVTSAILAENQILKIEGWEVCNRKLAQGENGLDAAARKMGIERLLPGPTPPRHAFWRASPPSNPEWKDRAEKIGLRLVPGG